MKCVCVCVRARVDYRRIRIRWCCLLMQEFTYICSYCWLVDLRTYPKLKSIYIYIYTECERVHQKRGAPMVSCCHTFSCYLSGSTDNFARCTPLIVECFGFCFCRFHSIQANCEHASRDQIDRFCEKKNSIWNCVYTCRVHVKTE